MAINIGKIRGTLEACVFAKDAIDSAVRAYEDAQILVDTALNAVGVAEEILRRAASAAEAQIEIKIQTAKDLNTDLNELIRVIKSARDIKKTNALDTCLAAREFVDKTAKGVERIAQEADSAADLSTIYEAALSTAAQELTDKKQIYDDAVSAAQQAKRAIISISRIRI